MSKNKKKQSVKSKTKIAAKTTNKAAAKSTPKASTKTAKAKKPAPKKVAAKKPVPKIQAKPKKVEIKVAASKKQEVKVQAKPILAKKSETEISKVKLSKAAEKANAKKAKTKKTETVELEDDFIPEDDFGGPNEIGEYEEELKAVETLDIEVEEELEWTSESKDPADEEIYLTDAEGNRYCRAKDCDQIASVDGYCRFHYLLFWKRIQVRKKILADGKLVKYVEELTARYPDKFVEMIRRDLRTQKDFVAAIQELEIDESELNAEAEEESQNFINEVHGIGETTGMDDDEF